TRNGTKRYRYYTCTNAQKRGWDKCPAPSVPAAALEALVVERLRALARDPALVEATVAESRLQDEARLVELEAERRTLERDLARWQTEERKLARPLATDGFDDPALARVADLQERIRHAEVRLTRVREQMSVIRREW